MKAYTDLEQSKKLAEILPIESADMWYCPYPNEVDWYDEPRIGKAELLLNQLPCWSLAALFSLLPIECKLEKTLLNQSDYFTYACEWAGEYRTTECENPINAVFEIVVWLKENEKI